MDMSQYYSTCIVVFTPCIASFPSSSFSLTFACHSCLLKVLSVAFLVQSTALLPSFIVVAQNIECPRHVTVTTTYVTSDGDHYDIFFFDFTYFYKEETYFCTRTILKVILFLFVFIFHKEIFISLPIMVAERGSR